MLTVSESPEGFTPTQATTGNKMITVREDDSPLGTITLTSSPTSVSKDGSGSVTLTAKIVLASPTTPNPTTAVSVSIVGKYATGTADDLSATTDVTGFAKNKDKDPATTSAEAKNTAAVTIAAEAENVVTFTASAPGYISGTRAVPVIDRDAQDVVGYRVVMVKPAAAGGWAKIGNDQVIVDVIRVGSVAYPWTAFGSIQVVVRDTAHDSGEATHDINQVTAADFNNENGTITFTESGNRGDVIWRGNDTIRFEIKITARGNSDPAADGQYHGVYAAVTFNYGNDASSTLTNLQDKTPVYPSNPNIIAEANRYVGDGKLVKLDNLAPKATAIAAVRVTSGSEVGANINATIGDEIRVAVKVSENVIFRDNNLQIQLQNKNGDIGDLNGHKFITRQRQPVTKSQKFTASQVIAASSDSLRHTWKITEGFFTLTLQDYVAAVGPKGSKHDLNNQEAQVRAGIGDQAGNYAWTTWTTFDVDSRKPVVSILYPSASPPSQFAHANSMHFTGAIENEDPSLDVHLNPLRILVDEEVSALKAFAAGADTLSLSVGSDIAGDSTQVYATVGLNSPAKDDDGNFKSTGQAGTEIELVILATDLLGNETKTSISGVTHDAVAPTITDWFPKTSLLENNTINNATRHPVITVPEAVDSVSVIYEPSSGADIVTKGGALAKGEHQVVVTKDFAANQNYTLTIFARDLAGNAFVTPADSARSMTFDAAFDNPQANAFKVTAASDSVVAGQALHLTIQAVDKDGDTSRNALTYKNDGASEVRISAMASGAAAGSVMFTGGGVTDNGDGTATLNAGAWKLGKRMVYAKSNSTIDLMDITVEHRTAGQGGTSVVGFSGSADSLYVDAADFAGFTITAMEDGVEVPEVWGDFSLKVVPVDAFGNPSMKAYKAKPANATDSLNVLDTRVKANGYNYSEFDIMLRSLPPLAGLPGWEWTIEAAGETFPVTAPSGLKQVAVQVRIDNTSLNAADTRSQNIKTNKAIPVIMPLTPVLTLWVPGSDVDEAGNDVVFRDMVTVTVAAEGFRAGSMVTFTKDGTAMDPVTANADGMAKLDIAMSESGTVVVSAMSGQYSTDALSVVFAKKERQAYADSDGNPVYLVYTGNSPPDMVCDDNDFQAFAAAYPSSEGDDNYNLLADIDGDADVDLDDFNMFASSWGRTAVGPSSKPLVLLPGINENAEFSLRLGSDRVVPGELIAVDVALANVQSLVGYGFVLHYDADKFEFVSAAPAAEDLLKSTGGETPLFQHWVADGQVAIANSVVNGTAVSGDGDVVQLTFRVLKEFEENARFEVADGLVFDPQQLSNLAVVAGVLELQSTPMEFALHQNFPNPFNPDTTIKYELAESADVTLQIYNVLGQVVRTLVAYESQNPGRYQVRWDGMDDRGVSVSSGVYFYQISAEGKFHDVRKLMLLK